MRRTIDRRRPGRRAGWAVALVTLGLSAACTPGILEQGEAGTGKPARGGEPTTGAANQVPGAATDCPATDELSAQWRLMHSSRQALMAMR